MFLICSERKLMRTFIVLAHFPNTHTHTHTHTHYSVIFLYAQEKIWKYIHQVINRGHFWRIKVRALYFSIFLYYLYFLLYALVTFMLKLYNISPQGVTVYLTKTSRT